MKKVLLTMQIIVSTMVWIFLGISSFILFIPDLIIWALTFWWDKRLWILHRYSIVWSLFYVYINPFWRIKVEGQENLEAGKVYVIISNHQSAFDIILLYRLMTHFKWVAKKELFKVPVIGWNLMLNRHVKLDRKSIKSALKMMQDSANHLKQGSSILIFPEGTRSSDGQIKRFKDGAFILAKKTSVPILPVVINGSFELLGKNGVIKLKQDLFIKILPEIPVEQMEKLETIDLTRGTQNIMTEIHRQIAPEYYKKNPIG